MNTMNAKEVGHLTICENTEGRGSKSAGIWEWGMGDAITCGSVCGLTAESGKMH